MPSLLTQDGTELLTQGGSPLLTQDTVAAEPPVVTQRLLYWIDPAGTVLSLNDPPYMAGPDVQIGGMPAIRASIDTIPFQPGGRYRNVNHGTRDHLVPLVLVADTPAGLEAAADTLTRALDPARGDGRLRATRHDGTERELTCRYFDGFQPLEATNQLTAWPSMLAFRAVDPYYEDVSDTALNVTLGGVTATPSAQLVLFNDPGTDFNDSDVDFNGGTQSQGMSVATSGFFPIFPPRLGVSEASRALSVVNDGQVPAWPIWTITGPASGVTVRNDTTKQEFQVTVNIAVGETLTIDTRPGRKVILDNNGQSVFPITGDSELFALIVGTNALTVSFVGAVASTSIAGRWRRRWLSA